MMTAHTPSVLSTNGHDGQCYQPASRITRVFGHHMFSVGIYWQSILVEIIHFYIFIMYSLTLYFYIFIMYSLTL
jgi:hypothetical protein